MSRTTTPEGELELTLDRKVSPMGNQRVSGKWAGEWFATLPNSFGLPAGLSCPGKTDFCKDCYGAAAERRPEVESKLDANMRALLACDSIERMTALLARMMKRFLAECDRRKVVAADRLFRIHWDGDFWSLDYAEAWARVMKVTPEVQYWTYTRSFVEPVNVVPILAPVKNLALYLSVDEGNVEDAVKIYGSSAVNRPLLALCAADYRSARSLGERFTVDLRKAPVPCPENAGKLPLMADGRGACVTCGICPAARRDIMFSTTHREDVAVSVRVASQKVEPPPANAVVVTCKNSGCDNWWQAAPGRGRKREYCSRECQVEAYTRRRVG
jgi:hypothetical protein